MSHAGKVGEDVINHRSDANQPVDTVEGDVTGNVRERVRCCVEDEVLPTSTRNSGFLNDCKDNNSEGCFDGNSLNDRELVSYEVTSSPCIQRLERQLAFYRTEYYNYKLSWELDQKRINDLEAVIMAFEALCVQRDTENWNWERAERRRLMEEIERLYSEKRSMHVIICQLTGVHIPDEFASIGKEMEGLSMLSVLKHDPISQRSESKQLDTELGSYGQATVLPPISENNMMSSKEKTMVSPEEELSNSVAHVTFCTDASTSTTPRCRQTFAGRQAQPPERSFY